MAADYDVVIVGGGMVGGCLALALSHSSLRVAIIESRPQASKPDDAAAQRAIALSWGSRCLLQQLDLWSSLLQSAVPIKHVHVSDKGRFGKTRLSAESQAVEALGYVVAAEKIEAAVDASLSRAGVDMFCPAELLAYQVESAKAVLTLRHNGQEQQLSCRLLVGADGATSTVREQGCFDLRQQSYQQQAITALLRVESEVRDVAYERFTAEGPIAMLPHFDDRYSVVWTMPSARAEQLLQLPEKDFIEILQQRFGQWLGGLSLLGSRQSFPLNLSYVANNIAARVVLIGNAAHQLHPVAGQGFNLGLRDAATLADVLLSTPGDIGSDEVLAVYAERRQLDQSLVIGFTDKLVKLFSSDHAAFSTLRNSGLLLMDKLPVLKNQFAQQTMGLAARLPRLRGES